MKVYVIEWDGNKDVYRNREEAVAAYSPVKVAADREALEHVRDSGFYVEVNDPHDVLGQTGVSDVVELYEWFGGISAEEVEAICDDIWPEKDNSELAEHIIDLVESID